MARSSRQSATKSAGTWRPASAAGRLWPRPGRLGVSTTSTCLPRRWWPWPMEKSRRVSIPRPSRSSTSPPARSAPPSWSWPARAGGWRKRTTSPSSLHPPPPRGSRGSPRPGAPPPWPPVSPASSRPPAGSMRPGRWALPDRSRGSPDRKPVRPPLPPSARPSSPPPDRSPSWKRKSATSSRARTGCRRWPTTPYSRSAELRKPQINPWVGDIGPTEVERGPGGETGGEEQTVDAAGRPATPLLTATTRPDRGRSSAGRAGQ